MYLICNRLHRMDKTTTSREISYYKSSNVCLSVCLSVCSLSPPRSFDGSLPNLVGVCRWTSELPLRGSFSKRSTGRRVNGSTGQQVDGSTGHFFGHYIIYDSRRHHADQSETTPLQKAHGVFCSLDG